jgi:hypothetical protein
MVAKVAMVAMVLLVGHSIDWNWFDPLMYLLRCTLSAFTGIDLASFLPWWCWHSKFEVSYFTDTTCRRTDHFMDLSVEWVPYLHFTDSLLLWFGVQPLALLVGNLPLLPLLVRFNYWFILIVIRIIPFDRLLDLPLAFYLIDLHYWCISITIIIIAYGWHSCHTTFTLYLGLSRNIGAYYSLHPI